MSLRKPRSGIRFSQRSLVFTFLFAILTVHVIFLRYQTIITLNHTKIVQILTNQLGSRLHHPKFTNNFFTQRNTALAESVKPAKILIWNKYWNSKALWHKVFTQIIHGHCPEAVHGNNCVFTFNRTELNTSDAVLFHLVDLHVNGEYELPETRRTDQIWIAMSYEPPFILNYLGLNATRLNQVFNRTMSYRTDADINVRHGRFLRMESRSTTSSTSTTPTKSGDISTTHFPRYVSNWIHSHDDPTVRNYAHGKRRLVAWFASSHGCTSHSRREHYVSQLQRYIPVDIYGSCGKYKCGVQKTMRNPYKVEHDDCYYLVSTSYKFVLAFENSICTDYITEKLYNNLKLNVVPIVLGGGDYTRAAPPHSVIDASKYTPKELAAYLKMLDKNDTLYNEYFQWKKSYFIEAYDGIPMACDLCIKMNDKSWRSEQKVYDQFDGWLNSGCSKGYGEK